MIVLLAALRAELGAELPEADIHEGWNSEARADRDPPAVVLPIIALCCCSAGDICPTLLLLLLVLPSRGLDKAGNIACSTSGVSYFLHSAVV